MSLKCTYIPIFYCTDSKVPFYDLRKATFMVHISSKFKQYRARKYTFSNLTSFYLPQSQNTRLSTHSAPINLKLQHLHPPPWATHRHLTMLQGWGIWTSKMHMFLIKIRSSLKVKSLFSWANGLEENFHIAVWCLQGKNQIVTPKTNTWLC